LPDAAQLLLYELTPDCAARAAFIDAASANWNESELARRADVTADKRYALHEGV
jgi:hypothetical protein